MIEVHADVDLSTKAESFFEAFIFANALVDCLQTAPNIALVEREVPSLLKAIAASSSALGLFS